MIKKEELEHILWEKVPKTVNSEGTTIRYQAWLPCKRLPLYIESRKCHIPHANGVGTWDHTEYVVLKGDEVLATRQTLTAAKGYAEEVVAWGM